MPPRNRIDFAALKRERDLKAAAATGSHPAALPAPPGPAQPPDQAGDAEDRAKLVEENVKAELAQTWFGAAFDSPTGPLADWLELAAAGIIAECFTEADAEQWIRDPENAHELMTMLSLSLPGQRVSLEDLETMNPSAVVRVYIKQLFDSVNGDASLLPQIGNLSLDGDAAPARSRVRRASLLPSAALYPTLPAACLQAATKRLGRAAFDTANTANQQRLADAEAKADGRAPAPLDAAFVSRVNNTHWKALSTDLKRRWDRCRPTDSDRPIHRPRTTNCGWPLYPSHLSAASPPTPRGQIPIQKTMTLTLAL
jgi:hypothetical protein